MYSHNFKIFRFKSNGERASKPFVYATCGKQVEQITSKMRHDYVVMNGNKIICSRITNPSLKDQIINDVLMQYIKPFRDDAIRTATELFYPEDVKEQLNAAMTETEIANILRNARLAV